jgi:hypothetical protein
MIRFLIWLGFIRRRENGTIRWPFHAAPWHCWKSFARHPIGMTKCWGAFYLFRNVPGVIKWEHGRVLPRRWGCGFFGLLEFGDRG